MRVISHLMIQAGVSAFRRNFPASYNATKTIEDAVEEIYVLMALAGRLEEKHVAVVSKCQTNDVDVIH